MVDQSTRLYSYQSTPGVMSIMLKIFIFCWFGFQTRTTYDEEPDAGRRRFYKVLGVSMSMWSLSVPVSVLLAFQVSSWWRYKVVTAVDVAARFVGQALLTLLFCSPMSPICGENTFSYERNHVALSGDFEQMDDSIERRY